MGRGGNEDGRYQFRLRDVKGSDAKGREEEIKRKAWNEGKGKDTFVTGKGETRKLRKRLLREMNEMESKC